MRPIGWLDAKRPHAAGAGSSDPARRARLLAQAREGLARIAGIQLIEPLPETGPLWIRPTDPERSAAIVRSLAAEGLPVARRSDGAIGLPFEPWFRLDDVTAVVLSVTKVAHYLDDGLVPE